MPSADRRFHLAPTSDLEALEAAASASCGTQRVVPGEPSRTLCELRAVTVGGLQVVNVVAPPLLVQRTRRFIDQDDRDTYKVVLMVGGEVTLDQQRRWGAVAPGQFVLYDTSTPYEINFRTALRQVIVAIPKSRLCLPAEALRDRLAVPITATSGLRRLVGGFLNGLAEELDDAEQDGGQHLADALIGMLGMTVASAQVDSPSGSTMLERVLAYLEMNLGDPELSVESVARAHHVSVRHLHRLFAEREDTPSAYIRQRRLERMRSDLANPQLNEHTVLAIAARWGLTDPAP